MLRLFTEMEPADGVRVGFSGEGRTERPHRPEKDVLPSHLRQPWAADTA